MNFSDVFLKLGEFDKIINCINNNVSPIHIRGASESAKNHLIFSTLANSQKTNAMIIAASDFEAQNIYADLKFFLKDNIVFFPSKDYVFYNAYSSRHQNQYDRICVAYKLLSQNVSVVCSVQALLQYTIDTEALSQNIIELENGKSFDLEELTKQLILMGYEREDTVEGIGQFSLRGGILDVFSPNMDLPNRIEFFDDEVDSIREFDTVDQLSIQKMDKSIVIPVRELIYNQQQKQAVCDYMKKIAGKNKMDTSLEYTYLQDIDNFMEKHYFPCNDKYAGMFYDALPTILQYISKSTLVFIDEPKNVSEGAKNFSASAQEEIAQLQEKSVIMPKSKSIYADWGAEVAKIASQNILVGISTLAHNTPDYTIKELLFITSKTLHSFHGKVEFLYDDLEGYVATKATVVIIAGSETKAKNLCADIVDQGIDAVYNADGEFQEGKITLITGNLKKGFYYLFVNFAAISDTEVFIESKRKKLAMPSNSRKLNSYTDINVGDYVVHQTHGIGVYDGIVQLKVDKIKKDFLKIRYNGTECLYVPPDQLTMIYKYVGNTDKTIKLSKLGGVDWTKTKLRVKRATKDLAQYLIKLYAEREQQVGFSFSADTVWQREFEDTFIYQETDDQLRCIEESKKDMENSRPMDRLLCGDVGYGKTEVALRAAFKAVMDSKQVAYLVPTTILAMQHYNTFVERMKDFPIKVEMLSRFRTAKQQKEIVKALKTGEVDIVIGTHRILQKDLQFRDLGLLIIDEEQRFGVAHKEKYKELKKNIDVLTLSATPIPRTLHMAMVNIRDMSVLEQPPEQRHPVQTYVIEYDFAMLIEAIKKEVSRGGQVYYLYNRVSGIYSVAEKLQAMLPEVKIAVGHGQMHQDALEDIMVEMVGGNIDVLVCTTIIETGLDIPNVNTIIIEDSDKMGLSQLYQLRGRVGRSNRRAYAYFVYKKDKVISEIAQKRLVAIKEFTEFGSGFKIAMRDLEIRGAGNLLGAEQHGHIDAVGYDTYCKILKESIDEEQGIFVKAAIPAVIDLPLDAYIPDNYIKNNGQRIDAYKKIAAIEIVEDRYEVEEEFIDRFGDMPPPVSSLMDIVIVKGIATKLGFTYILQKEDIITFRFDENAMEPSVIIALCGKYASDLKVSVGKNPYFALKIPQKEQKNAISHITVLLQFIIELKS